MKWLWLALIVAFVVGGTVVVGAMVERAVRGRRLTTAEPDAAGNVEVAPDALAAEASAVVGADVDEEAYALARMLASEGANDSALARRLRAWVAYNDAQALGGWSFVRLFTYSQSAGHAGRFGTQTGRRYSTARDPYEGDLTDAEALFAEFAGGDDPTNGATKFTDGDLVPASWIAEGYEADPRPDARAGFTLFRKVA